MTLEEGGVVTECSILTLDLNDGWAAGRPGEWCLVMCSTICTCAHDMSLFSSSFSMLVARIAPASDAAADAVDDEDETEDEGAAEGDDGDDDDDDEDGSGFKRRRKAKGKRRAKSKRKTAAATLAIHSNSVTGGASMDYDAAFR